MAVKMANQREEWTKIIGQMQSENMQLQKSNKELIEGQFALRN